MSKNLLPRMPKKNRICGNCALNSRTGWCLRFDIPVSHRNNCTGWSESVRSVRAHAKAILAAAAEKVAKAEETAELAVEVAGFTVARDMLRYVRDGDNGTSFAEGPMEDLRKAILALRSRAEKAEAGLAAERERAEKAEAGLKVMQQRMCGLWVALGCPADEDEIGDDETLVDVAARHLRERNKELVRDEKVESALAAMRKRAEKTERERDEAVGHLRNALFGPGEPPPCDCDEDVMHEHILQWNRLSDRARDWLVARDAAKEGV